MAASLSASTRKTGFEPARIGEAVAGERIEHGAIANILRLGILNFQVHEVAVFEQNDFGGRGGWSLGRAPVGRFGLDTSERRKQLLGIDNRGDARSLIGSEPDRLARNDGGLHAMRPASNADRHSPARPGSARRASSAHGRGEPQSACCPRRPSRAKTARHGGWKVGNAPEELPLWARRDNSGRALWQGMKLARRRQLLQAPRAGCPRLQHKLATSRIGQS